MHLDFQKNLGNTDRFIRVILGVILLGLTATRVIKGRWAALAGFFAFSQFIEAIMAY